MANTHNHFQRRSTLTISKVEYVTKENIIKILSEKEREQSDRGER